VLPAKVKVEKSELEMAKARNPLDAVLQCLLEKSHMARERLDEEAGKTPQTHSKDGSIAATGKRPSAQRATPPGLLCLDVNSPSVRERECSPSSPLPSLPEDKEGSEVTNSKNCGMYKLPPPTAPGPPRDACRSCIPSPLQPDMRGTPDDEPSPSPSTLIFRNMQRWKPISQRWKEASHRNQLPSSESMKILQEMCERQ
uniref:Uncharacterized protein n=1 Tax=Saimiri boliviensis boliviensis TaxID=39432 RepID=A0A2K6T0L1_SAIBB